MKQNTRKLLFKILFGVFFVASLCLIFTNVNFKGDVLAQSTPTFEIENGAYIRTVNREFDDPTAIRFKLTVNQAFVTENNVTGFVAEVRMEQSDKVYVADTSTWLSSIASEGTFIVHFDIANFNSVQYGKDLTLNVYATTRSGSKINATNTGIKRSMEWVAAQAIANGQKGLGIYVGNIQATGIKLVKQALETSKYSENTAVENSFTFNGLKTVKTAYLDNQKISITQSGNTVIPNLSDLEYGKVYNLTILDGTNVFVATFKKVDFAVDNVSEYLEFINCIKLSSSTNTLQVYCALTGSFDADGAKLASRGTATSLGYFAGELDGQGYTISNFTTQNGMFWYVAGATIKNIGLINPQTPSSDGGYLAYMGVSGKTNLIENVYVYVSEKVTYTRASQAPIGLRMYETTTIKNVIVDLEYEETTYNSDRGLISCNSNNRPTLVNTYGISRINTKLGQETRAGGTWTNAGVYKTPSELAQNMPLSVIQDFVNSGYWTFTNGQMYFNGAVVFEEQVFGKNDTQVAKFDLTDFGIVGSDIKSVKLNDANVGYTISNLEEIVIDLADFGELVTYTLTGSNSVSENKFNVSISAKDKTFSIPVIVADFAIDSDSDFHAWLKAVRSTSMMKNGADFSTGTVSGNGIHSSKAYYAVLTSNVEMINAINSSDESASWYNARNTFTGVLDGRGYAIQGLKFGGTSAYMFYSEAHAKVKNIAFTGVSFEKTSGIAYIFSNTTPTDFILENVYIDFTTKTSGNIGLNNIGTTVTLTNVIVKHTNDRTSGGPSNGQTDDSHGFFRSSGPASGTKNFFLISNWVDYMGATPSGATYTNIGTFTSMQALCDEINAQTVTTQGFENNPYWAITTSGEDVTNISWASTSGTSDQKQFEIEEYDDYCVITGLGDYSGAITIPEHYKGKPITAISDGAFKDCLNLYSVNIPASITTIGDNAFSGCKNLTSIKFVGSTKISVVGDGAFANTGLSTLNIPLSVTQLGEGVFENATKLTSIIYAGSVKQWIALTENLSWNYTHYVEKVSCTDYACSVEGVLLDMLEYTEYSTYVSVTGLGDSPLAVEVLASFNNKPVTMIADNAFSGKNIQSIIIPTTVKTIGAQAFLNCESLTKIDYKGTIEEWRQISANWNYNHHIEKIVCTDGSITPNGDMVVNVVEGGETTFKLVVPSSTDTYSSKAIDDFKALFKDATGLTLSTVADSSNLEYKATSKYIVLGGNYIYSKAGLTVDESVKNDGYQIITQDSSIFILGKTTRGKLFGAYELLTRLFEYERFTPDTYVINKNVKNLKLETFDILDNPDIDIRISAWGYTYYESEEAHALTMRLDMNSKDLWIEDNTDIKANWTHNVAEIMDYVGHIPADLSTITDSMGRKPTYDVSDDALVKKNGLASNERYSMYNGQYKKWTAYGYKVGWFSVMAYASTDIASYGNPLTVTSNQDAIINKVAQLCYSGGTAYGASSHPVWEEMVEFGAQRVAKIIKADTTGNKIFQFTAEDNAKYCQCTACLSWYDHYDDGGLAIKEYNDSGVLKYSGFMGLQLRFVNAMAKRVSELLPADKQDVKIATFCYSGYTDAPCIEKNGTYQAIDDAVKCPDNVLIYFAPSMDYTDNIHDSTNANNVKMLKILEAMNVLCKNVGAWLYQMSDYDDYFLPQNSYYTYSDLYNTFIDLGTKWIFHQGAQKRSVKNTAFGQLKLYLNSKMMWDSSLKEEDLIDKFFDGYFGPGSASMRAYFDELYNVLEDYDSGTAKLDTACFSYSDLITWMEYCDQALSDISSLASPDPTRYKTLKKNIQCEMISLKYLLIRLYNEYNGEQITDLEVTKTEFIAECKNLGINQGTGQTIIDSVDLSYVGA